MSDEQKTIEEMSAIMAAELMRSFDFSEQNACWLMIRDRLIAERQRIETEAKEAKIALKKLR